MIYIACIEFATRYMGTDTLATSDITPCMIADRRTLLTLAQKCGHIVTGAISWHQTPGLWRETNDNYAVGKSS